jgi:hypothetical protein
VRRSAWPPLGANGRRDGRFVRHRCGRGAGPGRSGCGGRGQPPLRRGGGRGAGRRDRHRRRRCPGHRAAGRRIGRSGGRRAVRGGGAGIRPTRHPRRERGPPARRRLREDDAGAVARGTRRQPHRSVPVRASAAAARCSRAAWALVRATNAVPRGPESAAWSSNPAARRDSGWVAKERYCGGVGMDERRTPGVGGGRRSRSQAAEGGTVRPRRPPPSRHSARRQGPAARPSPTARVACRLPAPPDHPTSRTLSRCPSRGTKRRRTPTSTP